MMRVMARRKQSSEIRIEGRLAYVALTQGKEAVIDRADVPLVALHKWHAGKSGKTFYALADVRVDGKWRTLRMHRLIMGFDFGDPREPDHRDRDGLNNRRKNLREATGTVQKLNQSLRKDNTSGTNGIHLRPDGRWQARVAVNKRRVSLGCFSTLQDAIQCRTAVDQIIKELLK